MLSSVLRNPIVIQVCISVVKAFVAMRTYLTTTSPETLAARLVSIDRRVYPKSCMDKLDKYLPAWKPAL